MTRTDSQHPQYPLEEIVAYLDGELSEAENAEVERRLSTDETYRAQMQGFDRVWSALDEMPSMTAADSFSKTTMELVVNAAEQEVQQQTEALPQLRRTRYVTYGVLVAVAALLGYLVTRIIQRDPNAMLIADLPVIEHVDIYSQFQSIDFLQQLQVALGKDDWAVIESPDPSEPAELPHERSLFDQSFSTEDRHRWVDQLTPDHLLTLRTKYNHFLDLKPENQQRLRQLHEELISAQNTNQLQRVMSLYQQWLEGQPSSRQYELRNMSEKLRVQATVRHVKESRRRGTLELTDEQMVKMGKYILRRMSEIRKRIRTEMPPRELRALESLDGHHRAWAQLRWLMTQNSDVEEFLHRAIVEKLTPEQREQFQKLSRQDKRWNIFTWARAARFSSPGNGRREFVSEQRLEEFFAEELDAALQAELLTLPRDVMRRRLMRLYWGEDRSHSVGQTDRDPRHMKRQNRDHRPGHPPRRYPHRDGLRPPEGRPPDRGPMHRGPPGAEPERRKSAREEPGRAPY